METNKNHCSENRKEDIIHAILDIKKNHSGYKTWKIFRTIIIVLGLLFSLLTASIGVLLSIAFNLFEEIIDSMWIVYLFVGGLIFWICSSPLFSIWYIDSLVMRAFLRKREITFINRQDMSPLQYDFVCLRLYRKYIWAYLRKTPAFNIISAIWFPIGSNLIASSFLIYFAAFLDLVNFPTAVYVVLMILNMLSFVSMIVISCMENTTLLQVRLRKMAQEEAIESKKHNLSNDREAEVLPQEAVTKNNVRSTPSSGSGLKTAAKFFMVWGVLSSILVIIPLFWRLPMTIHYFNKTSKGEPVSGGFKICCLIFASFLGGIFMLCDKD